MFVAASPGNLPRLLACAKIRVRCSQDASDPLEQRNPLIPRTVRQAMAELEREPPDLFTTKKDSFGRVSVSEGAPKLSLVERARGFTRLLVFCF